MSKYVNYDELAKKTRYLPISAIDDTFVTISDINSITDTVDIVRCKDCIYFKIKNSANQGTCDCGEKEMNYGAEFYPYPNDFCSYGIRKEMINK